MATITRVTRETSDVYLSGGYLGKGFSYRIERDCGHNANLATLGQPPRVGDTDDCMTCHTDAMFREVA